MTDESCLMTEYASTTLSSYFKLMKRSKEQQSCCPTVMYETATMTFYIVEFAVSYLHSQKCIKGLASTS